MEKNSAVIIGAGIGGLFTALQLCKMGFNVKIVEKKGSPGGFASSLSYKGYKIDIGPHYVSLIKNSEITNEIKELLGDDIIEIPNIRKWYKSYFHGKILDTYPTISYVIFSNGISSFIKSMFSFAASKFFPLKKNKSGDYLISLYGKFLYDNWCKPYLIQNYGHIDPPLEIIKKRFRPIKIKKILKKIIENNPKDRDHSESKFFDCYFRKGMGRIIEVLCKKITNYGGKFFFDANIKSITHENKVKILTMEQNNKVIKLEADLIVYATPLPIIRNWLNKTDDKSVIDTDSFNSIMAFLFIDTPRFFDGWVLSIFDTSLPFFRIAQQNYLSSDVCPPYKTLISVEIRAKNNDKMWKLDDEKIIEIITFHLKKMKLLKEQKIDGYKVIRFRNLYPSFRKPKKMNYDDIIKTINTYDNEFILVSGEMDTGRLVSEVQTDNKEETPPAGGIYTALKRSKELVKEILNQTN